MATWKKVIRIMSHKVKNALESGSAKKEVTLNIEQTSTQTTIQVSDRDSGMSKSELENALQPFYTTKVSGSGVGLPLCREIIEAHDGDFFIANRKNGGVTVKIYLPR